MRIQDLAIVFLIIILPISIILAAYTQYQIQTINTQTLYDNKLSSATYDAIRAFQINTGDNAYDEINNSKNRDLQSAVTTFKNLVMSTFSLDGYTQDDLDNYIPALVYTLYDGFYIYSPYTNVNYRYDENGKEKDDNGLKIYGLKPYISYSCRYTRGDIDVVITYALDNHITVQGKIGNEYVNKNGYLIDNINYNKDSDTVSYNGVEISEELLKEDLPVGDNDEKYSYVKLKNTKYYLDENNSEIFYIDGRNEHKTQYTGGTDEYTNATNLIKNNRMAKDYYIDAYNFTAWFKNQGLNKLTYGDACDAVVDAKGNIELNKIWEGNNTNIFQFNDSTGNYSNNIENELSSFNQHRLAVIRHKIEVNLAIAIANYNNYSGATNNVFQMPDLKENEWDYITHNISLISFLQGLPIGGKIYNGYSIATNSESKEVVLEQNIYILCKDKNNKIEYCRIGDKNINDENIYQGGYAENNVSVGRLNLDFKRKTMVINGETYYYYPIQDYTPSYNSIVMQNNVDTYDDIYAYVNGQDDGVKKAFYTALGRERAGMYKTQENYGL